jgi:transcription initiation factor IIF auxiliary subunit
VQHKRPASLRSDATIQIVGPNRTGHGGMAYLAKEVTYTLDPTFVDPVRTVRDRRSKFRLKTQGWGVFPTDVKIAKSRKTVMLKYNLVLKYPDSN